MSTITHTESYPFQYCANFMNILAWIIKKSKAYSLTGVKGRIQK